MFSEQHPRYTECCFLHSIKVVVVTEKTHIDSGGNTVKWREGGKNSNLTVGVSPFCLQNTLQMAKPLIATVVVLHGGQNRWCYPQMRPVQAHVLPKGIRG